MIDTQVITPGPWEAGKKRGPRNIPGASAMTTRCGQADYFAAAFTISSLTSFVNRSGSLMGDPSVNNAWS